MLIVFKTVEGFARLLFLICMLVSLSGCITHYKNIPYVDMSVADSKPVIKGVKYRLNKLPLLASGGMDAMADGMKNSKVLVDAERYFGVDEKTFYDSYGDQQTIKSIPKKGVFIDVKPIYDPLSLAALGFGYLSYSTLAILPSWSNQDGFEVRYHVYIDGKPEKVFNYEVERFVSVWIAYIPFFWLNAFTASEEKAFTAITEQFTLDFQEHLNSR